MILKLAKEEDDLRFLYNTRIHSKVAEMLNGNPPQSLEEHLNYINKVQEKDRWIYIAYNNDIRIGYGQIYNLTLSNVEVGFVIHPDFQGKGFGKELVLEIVNKTKKKFGDRTVYLYVKENNLKAIHIYKSLGFNEIMEFKKEDNIYMELK